MLNIGLNTVNNYITRAEKLFSQGLDKAIAVFNKTTGRVLSHLNKLPDIIAGKIEAFQSQLPQAATDFAQKVATKGQQVLISQWPTIQTTAQQTLSRHLQKIGQQIFGRPPFTSPQYS